MGIRSRREIADALSVALTEDPQALWQTYMVAPHLTGAWSADAKSVATVAASTSTPVSDDTPAPIGIWHPRRHGTGEIWFERNLNLGLDEERLWSGEFGWPARTHHRFRIVLIGESVARGFLLDPAMTAASVLRQQLDSLLGEDICEVIDLARTCLTNSVDLLAAAMQLAPDVAVVFAGNNLLARELVTGERNRPGTTEVQRGLTERLRSDGMTAFLSNQHEIASKQVFEPVLDAVKRLAESARVPLVFVLPEFNLTDWRDQPDYVGGAPGWLSQADLNRWLEGAAHAEDALERGDAEKVARLVEELMALDEGLSLRSLRMKGLSHMRFGDRHAARTCLEQARDLYGYFADVPPCPRVHARFQAMVRERLPDSWCSVVDVPKVLEDWCGELPGRRSFYDYCHLTWEGLAAVMAPVAVRILRILRQSESSGEDQSLVQRCRGAVSSPPAAVLSRAAFLAAIHNAHWGQPPEIIRYWSRTALAADPDTVELMHAYVTSRGAELPGWMSHAGEVLFNPETQLGRHLFGHEANLFDWELAQIFATCVADATGKSLGGFDRAFQRFDVEQNLSIGIRRLLFTHLLARPMVSTNVLSVLWPRGRLTFWCNRCKPLRLQLVARLPAVQEDVDEALLIHINGKPLKECLLTSSWRSYDLRLPVTALNSGVNQIDLVWPGVAATGGDTIESRVQELEMGRTAWFGAVFGELHAGSCLVVSDD